MFPFGQSIVLVTRTKGPQDSMGNDTWTTTNATVKGAFSPGSSVEVLQGQDVLTVQPSVFLPAGTAVSTVDAVQVGGLTYEVDGQPIDWRSPLTGWSPGLEVRLRRVS